MLLIRHQKMRLSWFIQVYEKLFIYFCIICKLFFRLLARERKERKKKSQKIKFISSYNFFSSLPLRYKVWGNWHIRAGETAHIQHIWKGKYCKCAKGRKLYADCLIIQRHQKSLWNSFLVTGNFLVGFFHIFLCPITSFLPLSNEQLGKVFVSFRE